MPHPLETKLKITSIATVNFENEPGQAMDEREEQPD